MENLKLIIVVSCIVAIKLNLVTKSNNNISIDNKQSLDLNSNLNINRKLDSKNNYNSNNNYTADRKNNYLYKAANLGPKANYKYNNHKAGRKNNFLYKAANPKFKALELYYIPSKNIKIVIETFINNFSVLKDIYHEDDIEYYLSYYKTKNTSFIKNIKQIGNGGFNIVYLYYNLVVRLSKNDAATNDTTTNDFMKKSIAKQLRFQKKIDNSRIIKKKPNIARILDVVELRSGRSLVFMEYYESDLGNLFKNRISDKHLLTIFYSIKDSLNIMHQLGYVHRDVKPDNILLKKFGNFDADNFFLADFDFLTKITDRKLSFDRYTALYLNFVLVNDYLKNKKRVNFSVLKKLDLQALALMFFYKLKNTNLKKFKSKSELFEYQKIEYPKLKTEAREIRIDRDYNNHRNILILEINMILN